MGKVKAHIDTEFPAPNPVRFIDPLMHPPSYSHYFHINSNSKGWDKIWSRLIADTKIIVAAADVALTAEDGPCYDEDLVTTIPPPIVSVDEGIYINGAGKGASKPLVIGPHEDGHFNYVKTNWKPYDVVVCCVLLRAAMLAPHAVQLSSDGFWEEELSWKEVRRLYQSLWPEDNLYCPWKEPAVEDPNGGSTGCAPS
ncbi:uncharacterized protein BP01DRAFT_176113 [Aspergillus saccharolyticus JOP 1030-1]|uniref:Uncharacterized protein n=1 Tax=Aspergillus saccharolyticus JOP 1030-1 TaxID=1450539 RepID=A0A318ZKH3_9EURO|nr:hypothetical protein BP01DRAFT_176113 [Aspergillus saccharolyticus JOP 1030-1]PYH48091.1 hypothetical protein BP01DRAFT_176113 [Aspergillus saccharolyticus JOP 1030-1]